MWVLLTLVAAVAWALISVLDSFLVHRYESRPRLLMWSQSLFTVSTLFVLSFVLPLRTDWWWLLFLFGFTAYIGDIVFFWRLRALDVSVVNAAWAIQALMQSIAGFLLFAERWSGPQFVGAVLILGAVAALSFWHKHVSWGRTLMLLSTLAAVYVPIQLFQKYALEAGVAPLTVFYWTMLPREIAAFTLPWMRRDFRSGVGALLGKMGLWFFLWNALVILLFFIGVLSGIYAYATGPISLVAVVGNVQPFLVLSFAVLWAILSPSTAPKELITRQSLTVKIVCFAVAFSGLAVLTGW
jgi:drug/metabolite transporter (DMT)-like permease